MLIVDIDKLFKQFVKDYLKKNHSDGIADSDVEDKTEMLYAAFNDTRFGELDGYTPATFYLDKKDILIKILCGHFENSVPVSDYLIDALIDYADTDSLASLLAPSSPDDLILIVLEVLAHKEAKNIDNRLIDLLFSDDCGDEVKDAAAEGLLYSSTFDVKDLLARCKGETKISGAICGLLSKSKTRNPEITALLTEQFISNPDKAPEYSSYIAAYGDESALPVLSGALKSTDDYVSYKEIGMAIEALGGTFKCDRDFSTDKNYIKIKAAGKNEHKTDD